MPAAQPTSPLRRFVARVGGALVLATAMFVFAAGAASAGDAAAPLLDGMGRDRGPMASRVPAAQRYFHQGMTLVWGFNSAEAARSFEAAIASDPGCALCYWGLAWSLGPNINADMDASAEGRVRAALSRAAALSPHASRRTRALVDALAVRHPAPGAIDEDAYAERMRALARAYPRDADIADACRGSRDEPAPLRLVGCGRRAAVVDTGNPFAVDACAGARAGSSWRQSLPDPLDGKFRASGSRARERESAARARPRRRPSAAHAVAHRHARRTLRRRGHGKRSGDCGGQTLRGEARRVRGVSRRLRRAQRPFPVGCCGDGGTKRESARRGARRLSGGVRTARRRPQHRHPATPLRAPALHAGPVRPLARDHRGNLAARCRRALSARDLALRARHCVRPDRACCGGAP